MTLVLLTTTVVRWVAAGVRLGWRGWWTGGQVQ